MIDDPNLVTESPKKTLIGKGWFAFIFVVVVLVAITIAVGTLPRGDDSPPNVVSAPYEVKSSFGTYYVQGYQIDDGILVIQFPTLGTPTAEDILIIGGDFEIRPRVLK